MHKIWQKTLKERNHLEDLGRDEGVILKCIFDYIVGGLCGLDRFA
jgi:hypothetical protein